MKPKKKFTPGPQYEYQKKVSKMFTGGKWERSGLTIRGEHTNKEGETRVVARCSTAPGTFKSEAKGNAILISRAPDMLKLIVEYIDRVNDGTLQSSGLVIKARRLLLEIAKEQGEALLGHIE